MTRDTDRVRQLKKEKNAIILAHYYVNDDVQEIADYVGDSYFLSKIAMEASQKVIVFCGVSFMGESAKILNPDKIILMPEILADCPMAHMAKPEDIIDVKQKYADVAAVCYINSSAQLKAHADVIVTSSNAVSIIKKLPQKKIYFLPDQHLGHYVAKQIPEKEFIFHDGFCPIHHKITKNEVDRAKKDHPKALVLSHPECREEVLAMSDYVGSTTGIIDFATQSPKSEFIINTEMGVLYELQKKNPDKTFFLTDSKPCCQDMKLITVEKVAHVLETMGNQVILSENLSRLARASLDKMHELAEE